MENSYGIGVANRYALFLDDESDPLETLSLKEQEKELKKKCKVTEKENKGKVEVPKTKTPLGQRKMNKEINTQKGQEIQNRRTDDNKLNYQRDRVHSQGEGKQERVYNKANNENREDRNNRKNREEKNFNGPTENRDKEERPRRENFGEATYENRNRERGGRVLGNKPVGPRGPKRNFDERRGKREFDRQSGSDKTGVKPIDKRDGGGAHNWGSHKDIIEEADKPNDSEQLWPEIEKTEANVVVEPKEEVENEQPVEEEPKELTLDEWKAQRAGRAKPQYNIRKAGEGEDPSQWKKMYELRKKEDETESEEEEYDATEYPQRVGRQKHVLDIDILFNDNRRGGGGTRGRGQRTGMRGAVNRSNPRSGGGANGQGDRQVGVDRPDRRFREDIQNEERTENRRAPKVDDERDFPSLG